MKLFINSLFCAVLLLSCNSTKDVVYTSTSSTITPSTSHVNYWQQHVDYKMDIDYGCKTPINI